MMANKSFLFISYLSVLSTTLCIECPARELLNPCTCSKDTDNGRRVLSCGGSIPINLKAIFAKLSSNLDKNSKHFERFILNNTWISVLQDNMFSDITFNEINIVKALNLSRIMPFVFSPNNTQTILDFRQFGGSLLGNDQYNNDLFSALSSLNNVQSIYLNMYSLKTIPEKAFHPITAIQSNLSFLNFNPYEDKQCKIKSIGNFAIYYLSGLKEIYINDQQIDYIPANAFDFWRNSEIMLFIYLSDNRLNDTSVQIGAFLNCQRPINIEFNNNLFTFLDQRIFEPILRAHERNAILFDGNHFDCDCRMYWLFKNKDTFMYMVQSVQCKNGKDFWALNEKDFEICHI